MVQTYALTRPELLGVTDGEQTFFGGNQQWYHDDWQRKAGCGPTAAAVMVRYLAQTREACRPLYPSGGWSKEEFTALMEELWNHITPGRKGVNTLHLFTKGLTSFANEKRVDLPLQELDVGRFRIGRPSIDQCAGFLRAGLEQDSPVAWLNLHSGRVRGLDSWHWVVITALELHSEGPILCTYLDGGREKSADFRLWFQSTRLGGGLIYLPRR